MDLIDRQTAADLLDNLIGMVDDTNGNDYDTALKMGVEALRADVSDTNVGDMISRQAAIDALEREKTYCRAFREGYAPIDVFAKYNAGLIDGIKALSNLPSSDAIEVVRCKDCYHYDEEHSRCLLNGSDFKPEDFCSYGSK